ncbi:MAG: hypothetical protein IPL61_05820 [Myxococcales bacterium]|nr:hypothetical protein [Myxococcales bacterium]
MASRTTLAAGAVVGLLLASLAARADDDPTWTAKLVARADDIALKVARARGLPVLRTIDKGVMDDAGLRARILLRMDEDAPPAERAADAAVAKRWGLVPMATDLDALIVDLLTEQIAGFYDPAEAKLYVSAKPGSDDTWADMLMAHEITHALQDQHFDLTRWMKAVKDDNDGSLARQALVEGDGVALMIEYSLAGQGLTSPWDHDDVVRLLTSNMDGEGGGQLIDAAPVAVREAMLFPYRAGIGFVAALRKGQPWAAVDAAFARPPRTTEQVLHPALYLADARADEIVAPPDPLRIDTSVWGEEGWREFLVAHGLDPAIAASAAAGWGGDRVIVRGPKGAVAAPWTALGVAVTTWDTDVDALEFWDAGGRAVDHLAAGTEIEDGPTRAVWLTWQGRVTAIERRDRRIAIVTGATLATWRATLDDAWRWSITWAKRP